MGNMGYSSVDQVVTKVVTKGGGRVPHVLSVKVVANVSGSCEEWGWKLPTQGGLHVCACMGCIMVNTHVVCVC